MKLVFGKPGKLWPLIGVPIILGISVLPYWILKQSALRVICDQIQVGMTRGEVYRVWNSSEIDQNGNSRVRYGRGPDGMGHGFTLYEPDSVFLPGRIIVIDFDEDGRVARSEIQWPGIKAILNYWKRQLGL